MENHKHDWVKVNVEVNGRKGYRYKCSICEEWWLTRLDGKPVIETWLC